MVLRRQPLVTLVYAESIQPIAECALDGRTNLFSSDLALTELTSALARLLSEGRMPSAEVEDAYRRISRHFEENLFERVALTDQVYRSTERLLQRPQLAIGRLFRCGQAMRFTSGWLFPCSVARW